MTTIALPKKKQEKKTQDVEDSVKAEKKELTKNYLQWKNNYTLNSRYELDRQYLDKLTKKWTKIFQKQLNSFCQTYGIDHLEQWKSTLIIDSENYQRGREQFPICICGILIRTTGEIKVKVWMVKNAYHKQNLSKEMKKSFTDYLEKYQIPILGTHGGNQAEFDLIADWKEKYVNTGRYLRLLRKAEILPAHIKSIGTFAEHIKYERLACKFFKHKWQPKMWFKAMNNSLDAHVMQRPQKTCVCCGKPQDILQYCTEDAFIAFLIFLLYKKHEAQLSQ